MQEWNFHDIESILRENNRRHAENEKAYNPWVGTEYCKEIPRTRIEIKDAPFRVMNIPVEMRNEKVVRVIEKAGWSLEKAGASLFGGKPTDQKTLDVWRWFCKVRCRYDCEFWLASEIKIDHKLSLTRIPFVLNRAQRRYLAKLEKMRKKGVPIFIILLKARQWGGSTLTQFYMVWIQMFHKKNWNSVIAADTDDHARNMQAMFQNALDEYDTFITEGKHIKFTPYKGMQSTRQIEGRGARITIGSVNHPDFIRSSNIAMAHLTEVGVWPTTPKHDPQSLAQAIAGTIVRKEYRLKVLESTAKGVGNFFHRTWLKARLRKNEYEPLFVPWYEIDFYQTAIFDYTYFINSMSEYHKYLFKLGATLEAIAYYRGLQEGEYADNPKGLMEEFPSTWEEAFQSTGRNFYPQEYVDELRKGVEDPKFVGDIAGRINIRDIAGRDDIKDKSGVFEDLHLVPESTGCLQVWRDKDDRPPMRDRYLVVVDIGGRSKNADYSVICVFDRYWMQEGENGVPEVVAQWRGHIDWDLLGWKAAQIAAYYDNALLVVESNTLEMKGHEGNHFNTLLSEIADVYPNMYRRTKDEQLVKGGTIRYGFQTNSVTKPMVCDYELWALREGMYIERSEVAVNEHATFEVKDNGELGAVEGNHDDCHITRAIGNYFNWKIMPAPKIIKLNPDPPKRRTGNVDQFGAAA